MKKHFMFMMLAVCFSLAAIAQRNITGTLADENGEGLIGATVIEEDTGNGTITDANGKYEITVSKNDAALIFSYTGYAPKRMVVGASNTMDAVMETSVLGLNEVVVVGFGTQVRSNITGNVSTVSGKDIEGTPVTSLESALQGRAPGVFISKQNGKTGQGINVRIRGAASINASNEPLYVIDGIVMTTQSQATLGAATNPTAGLNFNDVESVEILKDASAAAIYGSRGSNGVVLITTKKGKSGAPQFSFDISTGMSNPTGHRKWLNAAQYHELWDEAFNNVADADGLVYDSDAEWWKNTFIPGWDGGYDTDWEKEAFNDDAGLTQAQLDVSGGSDKTRYYISGGVLDQTGIMIYDKFERWSGRLNLTHDASEKINLGMNMSLSRTANDRLPDDNSFATPLQLVAQPTVQPLYDPENPENYFDNTVYFNGKLYEDNTSFKTTVFRNLGNVFLNYSPLDNLTVHIDFGLDFLTQNEDQFVGTKVARDSGEPGGSATSTYSHNLNYSTNNYLAYATDLGASRLDVTAGMSFQQQSASFTSITGRNFPNDNFQNLASAGEISDGTEYENEYAIVSYFGRANYSFDGKYLLSLSGRMDGDSRFGKDNRYGFFPAASAGWILSKESFLENNTLLSYLKMRASYGLTGNTPIEYFASQGLYDGRSYAGNPGIIPTQVANPELHWEKTTQFNAGVDFGILDDRFSGQVDYYIKNTDDLLLNVNIPATSGFLSQLQNIGELQNKGIEVLLSSNNLNGAFKWKTSVNFAKNKNKVINIDEQVIEGGFINRVVEGSPIGVFFTPEFAGVDPANGDALYYVNTVEGDKSTTNDINTAERIIAGDPNPDFIYGFSNDFSFKGIELSIFFQGVKGGDIFNGGAIYQMDGFGWFDNQDIRMLDRWQQPGDQTDIPQVRFLEGTSYSSRFIEDGTYLRLKNISLAYNLPKSVLSNVRISSLKIYVTAQNLWTITDYHGWDPEVNADFTASNIGLGTDFYSAPQEKTVVFGVKIGL